ncbi:energy transducer TonB [Aestuariispira insulae]|uniref:Protein TonB n=1 Tax=Aestuariispira insulae TaxID=1461337 RepID=A0A3D9H3V1_9PROT|nr:energy transducer TonB [Aestuariispira insulae]RED44174.1 protein TonB [Aestuariispira insulae]
MLDRSDLPLLILAIFLALGLQTGLAILFYDASDIGARAPGSGGRQVAITLVAAQQQIAQIQAGPQDQSDSEAETVADPVQESLPHREEPIETVSEIIPEPLLPETATPVSEPEKTADPEPVQGPQLPTAAEADFPKTKPVVSKPPFPRPVKKPVRRKPKKTEAATEAQKQNVVREATVSPASAKPVTVVKQNKPRKKTGEDGVHARSTLAQDGWEGASTDRTNQEGGQAVIGNDSDYAFQVRLWLERHKVYPKKARRKRKQGIVTLYFRVSRDGRVLAQDIRQGSGHEILDEEVLAMLKRAQPLPPLPDNVKGAYADMIIPIDFSLRGNR